MASNKKEHSLFVKVVDGRVTGEAKGDAAKLINAIIEFMDENETFESLITTAASIHYFRNQIKEQADSIKKTDDKIKEML